jgi:hypothetical protein
VLGLFPRRHTGDARLHGRGLAVEIRSHSVSDGLNRIVFMKHYPDSWLPAMFGVLLLPSIGACQRVKPIGSDEIRVSGTIELTPVGVNCWRLTGGRQELRAARRSGADRVAHQWQGGNAGPQAPVRPDECLSGGPDCRCSAVSERNSHPTPRRLPDPQLVLDSPLSWRNACLPLDGSSGRSRPSDRGLGMQSRWCPVAAAPPAPMRSLPA